MEETLCAENLCRVAWSRTRHHEERIGACTLQGECEGRVMYARKDELAGGAHAVASKRTALQTGTVNTASATTAGQSIQAANSEITQLGRRMFYSGCALPAWRSAVC